MVGMTRGRVDVPSGGGGGGVKAVNHDGFGVVNGLQRRLERTRSLITKSLFVKWTDDYGGQLRRDPRNNTKQSLLGAFLALTFKALFLVLVSIQIRMWTEKYKVTREGKTCMYSYRADGLKSKKRIDFPSLDVDVLLDVSFFETTESSLQRIDWVDEQGMYDTLTSESVKAYTLAAKAKQGTTVEQTRAAHVRAHSIPLGTHADNLNLAAEEDSSTLSFATLTAETQLKSTYPEMSRAFSQFDTLALTADEEQSYTEFTQYQRLRMNGHVLNSAFVRLDTAQTRNLKKCQLQMAVFNAADEATTLAKYARPGAYLDPKATGRMRSLRTTDELWKPRNFNSYYSETDLRADPLSLGTHYRDMNLAILRDFEYGTNRTSFAELAQDFYDFFVSGGETTVVKEDEVELATKQMNIKDFKLSISYVNNFNVTAQTYTCIRPMIAASKDTQKATIKQAPHFLQSFLTGARPPAKSDTFIVIPGSVDMSALLRTMCDQSSESMFANLDCFPAEILLNGAAGVERVQWLGYSLCYNESDASAISIASAVAKPVRDASCLSKYNVSEGDSALVLHVERASGMREYDPTLNSYVSTLANLRSNSTDFAATSSGGSEYLCKTATYDEASRSGDDIAHVHCDCECGMVDPDCFNSRVLRKAIITLNANGGKDSVLARGCDQGMYCTASAHCALISSSGSIYTSYDSIDISEPCERYVLPGETYRDGFVGSDEDYLLHQSDGSNTGIGDTCVPCPGDTEYAERASRAGNGKFSCNFRASGTSDQQSIRARNFTTVVNNTDTVQTAIELVLDIERDADAFPPANGYNVLLNKGTLLESTKDVLMVEPRTLNQQTLWLTSPDLSGDKSPLPLASGRLVSAVDPSVGYIHVVLNAVPLYMQGDDGSYNIHKSYDAEFPQVGPYQATIHGLGLVQIQSALPSESCSPLNAPPDQLLRCQKLFIGTSMSVGTTFVSSKRENYELRRVGITKCSQLDSSISQEDDDRCMLIPYVASSGSSTSSSNGFSQGPGQGDPTGPSQGVSKGPSNTSGPPQGSNGTSRMLLQSRPTAPSGSTTPTAGSGGLPSTAPSGSTTPTTGSGGLPSTAPSGSTTPTAGSGGLPSTAPSGSTTPTAGSGGLPSTAPSGSTPPTAGSGGLPSTAPSGSTTPTTGSGGLPSTAPSGSTTPTAGSGGLPSTAPSGSTTPTAGSGGLPSTASSGSTTQPGSVPSTAPSGSTTPTAGSGGLPSTAPSGSTTPTTGSGGLPSTAPSGSTTPTTGSGGLPSTAPSGSTTPTAGSGGLPSTAPSGSTTPTAGSGGLPSTAPSGSTTPTAGSGGLPSTAPSGSTTRPGSVPSTAPSGSTTRPGSVPSTAPSGSTTQPGGLPSTAPSGSTTRPGSVPSTAPSGSTTRPGSVPSTAPSGSTTQPGGLPSTAPSGSTTRPGGLPSTAPSGSTTPTAGSGGVPSQGPAPSPSKITLSDTGGLNSQNPKKSSITANDIIDSDTSSTEVTTVSREIDSSLMQAVNNGNSMETTVAYDGGIYALNATSINSYMLTNRDFPDLDRPIYVMIFMFDQDLDQYVLDTGIIGISTSATATDLTSRDVSIHQIAEHYRTDIGESYDPADRSSTATYHEPWVSPKELASEIILYSSPRRQPLRRLEDINITGSAILDDSFLCPTNRIEVATNASSQRWDDREMRLSSQNGCQLRLLEVNADPRNCEEALESVLTDGAEQVCRSPGLMPPVKLLHQDVHVPMTNRFNVTYPNGRNIADPQLSTFNSAVETTTTILISLHFAHDPSVSNSEMAFTSTAKSGGDKILSADELNFRTIYAGASDYRGSTVETSRKVADYIKNGTSDKLVDLINSTAGVGLVGFPADPPYAHLTVKIVPQYEYTMEFLNRESSLKTGAWSRIAKMTKQQFLDTFQETILKFDFGESVQSRFGSVGNEFYLEPGKRLSLHADARLIATYDTTTPLPWRAAQEKVVGMRLSVTSTRHKYEEMTRTERSKMEIRIEVQLTSQELQSIATDSYTYVDFLSAFGSAIAIMGLGASVYVVIIKALLATKAPGSEKLMHDATPRTTEHDGQGNVLDTEYVRQRKEESPEVTDAEESPNESKKHHALVYPEPELPKVPVAFAGPNGNDASV